MFKFVELQEKVSFQRSGPATSRRRFGIPIPEVEATAANSARSAAEREALVKMHEVALAYFREQLATPRGRAVARLPAEGSRAEAGDDR